MSGKKSKIISSLSEQLTKQEKRNKKVLISLTENEHNTVSKIADDLNTTVPKVIQETLILSGIFNEKK
ncbi:hypothetical protein HUX57_09890 [Arcobacter butzleri]|uniref:hypothetical protein n=1 Tax=Aliarcobacter butzleri TaxID=28197 RepID=UPI000DB8302F|nr:hypothetical protein [Aliarcobacter butzleri]MCG3710258.1 hypothetical protein [Aliarcobacter butzleri]MCG3714026.1 hypothetical protein [Aliarcobacter butzleri]MCT7591534.1 hypothetical protein [Aliarcobacter butzleri]MDN5061812.1 hypothetical protein [Aliarcobacter butzleri]NUW26977.1 hypothetical protein [Aliarcobacter butzleri]